MLALDSSRSESWNLMKNGVNAMSTGSNRTKQRVWTRQSLVALLCVLLIAPGDTLLHAGAALPAASPQDDAAPPIPPDQLDSLVAPVALYPDPLLAQVLAASTYPLEIIQLQQWLGRNGNLKDQALTDAVMKQDWDPSVQALAPLPDLVKRLADDIKWTTDLGNAFLAQQNDVMDAVQRMREKAQAAGNLKSNQQMKVQTETVESKQVIVIQPANPQVVYVPVYTPTVVYGPPIYPYPAIYYPPPSYYVAGAVFAFGVGLAIGAAWGGGYGWGCGWGRHNTIVINNRNNYVSHYNNVNINRNTNINVNRNGNSNWQHNAQHRGGTPYSNKATATKYGGTTRDASASTRQANARQQQGSVNRQQPSAGNRPATGANRPGSTAGSNAGTRPSNTSANRGSGGGNGGGGNNIGNRQVPGNNNASRDTSAFGGSSSRASTQASSARGTSSLGGGASRGGGAGHSGGGRRK
jgi:hypothetical protein